MSPNITVTSVRLSNIEIARAASKSEAHRALVNIALKHDLLPMVLSEEESVSLTVNVHVDMLAKLKAAAEKYKMTPSGVFGALANAGMHYLEGVDKKEGKIKKANAEDFAAQLLLDKGDEVRPKQQEFWMNLISDLALDKIVMVEGTTGVGKGKAIISAAIAMARSGKKPVVIAAPTVKVIGQLYGKEYLENKAAVAAAKGLKLAFLPGNREFVDSARLREYLLVSPVPQVSEWIENGAPIIEATALGEVARRAGITLSWLTSDLRVVANGALRAEDFALKESRKDGADGVERLTMLREYAADADIVFCTHTMLAIQQKIGWCYLPLVAESVLVDGKNVMVNRPVFIIDEGHVFEEAVAGAMSSDLSLQGLRIRLKQAQNKENTGAGSAIAKAIKTVNELRSFCKRYYNGDTITIKGGYSFKESEGDGGMENELVGLAEKLSADLCKKGAMQKVEGINDDIETVKGMIKTLRGKDYNRLLLTYSPQREYPSFSLGPASVGGELANIWGRAKGGAALVSATLWVPSWQGREQADYMCKVLNIPLERRAVPGQVVWDEIYKTPTRFLPDKSISRSLMPPDDQSQEKLDKWCKAQAEVICRFNAGARGGTLILCTSYSQVKALGSALVEGGIHGDRLVLNSGRLVDDHKRFVGLHKQNMRPLWLALGPAWTGLDLSENPEECPADADALLTDLVITRIPIGLNRSVTHQARMTANFKVAEYEALLRFKQGLGRLVRRGGLKDRRLLLLDGRLTCDTSLNSDFMKKVVDSVFLLIDRYKKKGKIGD